MSPDTKEKLFYLSTFEYPSKHAHPRHALLMAKAFSREYPGPFEFVVGRAADSEEFEGMRVVAPFSRYFDLLKMLRLRTLAYGLWLFWRLPRTGSIVFTNDLRLAAIAGVVKRIVPFTLVIEVHGESGSATRHALNAANLLVFVTNGLRDELCTKYAIGTDRTLVLGNAVSVEFFGGDKEKGRVQAGIERDAWVIGYAGRFSPMQSDKGIRFLIEAVTKIPEVHLLLVGGTDSELMQARNYASELGVIDRVHLVGYVPGVDVPNYLQACDVLAYVPPRSDSFLSKETSPMKLFEYQAAHKPVIVSDLPAFREALLDTALFVKPGSLPDFCDAVESVRMRPETVVDLVSRGLARAQSNTWEARARQIIASLS